MKGMAISIPWIISGILLGIALHVLGNWTEALIATALYHVIALVVTIRFLIIRRRDRAAAESHHLAANSNYPPA